MTALVSILMGIPTTARYITMVTAAARCMVNIFIRANFQKSTGVLTASGADQAKLLYQNLGFVLTKPRLNPAQAAAAPCPGSCHAKAIQRKSS